MATYTDITHGARVDITVEFLSKRALHCRDELVTRLFVADERGTQFRILVSAASKPYPDLATGNTYHVTGLLGAAPDRVSELTERNSGVSLAAEKLGIQDTFGIIDAETTLGLGSDPPRYPEPGDPDAQ